MFTDSLYREIKPNILDVNTSSCIGRQASECFVGIQRLKKVHTFDHRESRRKTSELIWNHESLIEQVLWPEKPSLLAYSFELKKKVCNGKQILRQKEKVSENKSVTMQAEVSATKTSIETLWIGVWKPQFGRLFLVFIEKGRRAMKTQVPELCWETKSISLNFEKVWPGAPWIHVSVRSLVHLLMLSAIRK